VHFQTIFYLKDSGQIVNVIQNKYIKSKFEKARFCPGHAPNDICFIYFKATDSIGPDTHKVCSAGPVHPPYLTDAEGIPLVFTDSRRRFLNMIRQFPTIIVDLYLSMGDNLLRAAAVAAAQIKYPETKFYCAVLPEFREVMALCPDIALFTDYGSLNLDPDQCAKISMSEGPLWDPRGPEYGKASLYGLYLNVSQTPYNTRLKIPTNFNEGFANFTSSIGLRDDGHNVIFQLRSKDWSDKCWPIDKIDELAKLIHTVYDCTIFYLGSDNDLSGEHAGLVNLCGKTSWIQTVYLLTKASKIFCVDSAVMHLSRALGIPYYCLWGHTTPGLILGQDPGPGDIMAPPKKGRIEMQDITPAQVFDKAFRNAQSPGPLPYDPAQDVSDFGAEEIIFHFFNEHPPANKRLVDVGAYGKSSSNTYGLLRNSWKGLLIEANPESARKCRTDFTDLDVKILNIGVSDEAGQMPLYLHKVVSSSSLLADWDPHEHTGKKIMVRVEPVDEVLKKHQIPLNFDFLAVDAEGMDYRIVKKMFETTEYRPRLIITECTSYPDATGFFNQYGYEFITKIGNEKYGNLLFSKKEQGNYIYDPAKNTSQFDEQEIIFKHFQGHPPAHNILVDVGAYGKELSNTFALLELGWKGLLIEANPIRAKIIEKEFAGMDVEVLNIGVSNKRGTAPLYLHTSPFSDSLLPEWDAHIKTGETITIDTLPLRAILLDKNIPLDFDLLSVDTEGTDELIMKHFFLKSDFRPGLIVTERMSFADNTGLFERYGYALLAKTGSPENGNLIFLKKK